LVLRTSGKLRKPLLSTHAAQSLQPRVKRKQTQPTEALAERMFLKNGSSTIAYNGTNPLKSVLAVIDRRPLLTHSSPLSVLSTPVKPTPVKNVTEQLWRAWIGAPTSAAVAIATLRQIVAIVERSFMFVLMWSLSRVMSSSRLTRPTYTAAPRLMKPFGQKLIQSFSHPQKSV
jgi:hypothetical protein